VIEELLKVEVVAPRAGMSRQALYKACREKRFPHVRIGRRIRIPASELAAWIREQAAKNSEAQTQNECLDTTI